jgi:hypothetical protein
MIGFEGRLQWRQHKPFKLRAKLPQRKKTIIQRWLRVMSQVGPNLAAHPKFAIRSFFVRRTRNGQGGEFGVLRGEKSRKSGRSGAGLFVLQSALVTSRFDQR